MGLTPLQRVIFSGISSLLFAASCAGSRPPSGSPRGGTEAVAQGAVPPPPVVPVGPRYLQESASFSDLVAAAQQLETNQEGDSTARCLLRPPEGSGGWWRFEADVAATVRPLPEPPADLDGALHLSSAPVLILSRWGQVGRRPFALALALISATPLSARDEVVVLALTDRGAYLRSSESLAQGMNPGPRPLSEMRRLLTAGPWAGLPLVLTAEAAVPLRRIRDALALVPPGVVTALAVALDDTIEVPPPPAPPVDRGTGLCTDGLPPLPDDAPRGNLDPGRLRPSLSSLSQQLQACMERTTGTAAPGGRLEVLLRLDAQGQVVTSCLLNDERGGTEWRHCALQAVQGQPFPAPVPSGFVDLALPLRLRPTVQQPLCP